MEDTSKYWDELASENIPDDDTTVGGQIRRRVVKRGSRRFAEYQLDWNDQTVLLDAACGFGRFLVPMDSKLQAVGMDLSPKMLDRCKKNLKDAGAYADLIRADMRDVPFRRDAFNIVLCLNSIYYVNSKYWKKIVNGFIYSLKTNGEVHLNLRLRKNLFRAKYGFGIFLLLGRLLYELEKHSKFRKLTKTLGFRSTQGNYVFFAKSRQVEHLFQGLIVRPLEMESDNRGDKQTYSVKLF